MRKITPESDALSVAGRAAHDIGLAALFGGNLFGRLAMHPALEDVSSAEERGKVVNAAWRRYGTVNSLSLAAILAGWIGARSYEAEDRFLTERERALYRAKDVVVGAVALTGVASAVAGVRFGHAAPGGAVPLDSGTEPGRDTPPRAARTKRVLNVLGRASALSELALLGVQAAIAQESFRRPPKRRVLKRRY
jgi:hypothetical protein